MNPLNWLPFYNEDKQGENFDGSLLLPLTVGLVSVVSSVLVGYRSGLLSRKQAASLIVKQVEQVERSANSSSREMTKRKPSSKSSYRPNATATDPVASSPSTVDVVPVLEKALPSKSQNKQTDDQKLHSVHQTHPQPAYFVQSQKSETQDITPEDTIVDSIAPKPTSAPSKRNKKSKHSRQTRSEPEQLSSNSVNSTEQDIAWVVVTSKKLKQSASGDQASSKVSRKVNKLSESTLESKSITPAQPEINMPFVDTQARGDISRGEGGKPTVAFKLHTETAPKSSSASSSPNDSARETEEEQQSQPTGDGFIAAGRPTVRHIQEANQSHTIPPQTTPPSVSRVPPTTTNTTSATTTNSYPSDPHYFKTVNASLPATLELLTQHLSSQVGAKELECQLLRDEVIRLREEVGILKHSGPIKRAATVDVETMTTPQEPPIAVVSKSSPTAARDMSSSKAGSSSTPRSDSPDTVLLLTLQKEIERLAREMKLSQQRNENLEARLNTANKQLTVAKSDGAKQLKLAHQELASQTQRAQQSEEAQQRMENELRETLQQLECTRRKAEQWERERTILVNERDNLNRERDNLTSQHQACLSELESAHNAAEELRATLRDVELRAQSVERDRSAALGESQCRITQLEAKLSASQEQEQSERMRAQKVESALAQLNADAEQLRSDLEKKEEELRSWKEKCESFQRNLSELSEQQQTAETRTSLSAETIRSVSDTKPVAASALTLLEATTQTDPEPSAEFEAESVKVSTDGEVGTNCRTPELNVSEVNMVAISPVPNSTENITNEDLKAEVDRYKTALNMTESVLADLQNSVDEEAERWRKALDASRMECEVLEDRLTKTESSLNMITEERDALLRKLEEIPIHESQEDQPSVCHQSAEDDRSSVQSLTMSRMLDSVRFDETTPKPELIRLLNKFRYLIQVEHDALKKEQSISSQLHSQLAALERRTTPESAYNGAHSPSPLAADSKSTPPVGFPSDNPFTSDQLNETCSDGAVTVPVSDAVAKPTTPTEVESAPGVLTNGLHQSDLVDTDSVAP